MHYIKSFNGQIEDVDSLEKYIIKKCYQHRVEKRAFAFALIIYDFSNPHIAKIFEDEKYFNAFDYISDKYLTVFYINSEYMRNQNIKAKKSNRMILELKIHEIKAPINVSPKVIGEKLLNEETLPSPSIIFFNILENNITDYTIAKLRENKVEDCFNEIIKIIEIAVNSLKNVKEENRKNEKEIFNLLKNSIEESELLKNVKLNFDKIISVKDFIFFWKL